MNRMTVLLSTEAKSHNDLLIMIFFLGRAMLDDFPDSPGPSHAISAADANSILDSEEPPQAMDSATGDSDSQTPGHAQHGAEDSRIRKRKASSLSEPASAGPSLPPIYYSVVKKRLNRNVVRHLDGNAYGEVDSTNLGASTSSPIQVGSFANANDKRHNHTTHRHDHVSARNISTSFDPNTFECNTCQGVHKVLHRTVEGTDVGLISPPVFILTDQNFPPMVPVGGEGECLKILQIENGTLVKLVDAFLVLTRGFDVPASTVALLGSASYAALVGTADYCAEFVRAAGRLRGAFSGGINTLHGIPFLLGGTKYTPAIRALAEIEHWVSMASQGHDDISATRRSFANSLRSTSTSGKHEHVIKLPASLVNSERQSFVVSGFDNLKTAVEPMEEEEEKNLLALLIEELNDLYPVNLDTDFVCDRFTEKNVFEEENMDRTDLVLLGASHLSRIRKHLNDDQWNVLDLTKPGWRVNADNVRDLIDDLAATVVNWDTTTVILQLYDNSVYMVGGQEGEKTLPKRGQDGVFHIDGHLVVADKDTVKSLTSLLMPLLKILGNSRKLFLTPLARYWIGPCCDAETHHTNYRAQGYLPRLGDAIHALRDNIRDGLFTRRVPNFRVLCPNRMIGVGQRRMEPTDEEAALSAALWGTDPVHPSTAAYRQMAEHIEVDLANSEARYTNPVKKVSSEKRQRVDLSLHRADWVSGCSAAANRRENPIIRGHQQRAMSRGGNAYRSAHNRGNTRGRGIPAYTRGRTSARGSGSARGSSSAPGARGHNSGNARYVHGRRGRWGSF
jgi:hypothetical protein